MVVANKAKKPQYKEGLTFDDVLLVPRKSNVLPVEVDTSVKLTKSIKLGVPIFSAAMDTVTEARLAIALAQEGGIGVIHKNMSIHDQCDEVLSVKKAESWVILDPIVLSPNNTVANANQIIKEMNISSFPIIENGRLVGIVTNRDLRFQSNPSKRLSEIMTKKIITLSSRMDKDTAISLMDKHRIEKLPVVDDQGRLKGLITIKDIEKSRQFPHACRDKEGHLMVGAAVGVNDEPRAEELVASGVDLLVVDTAHGHSDGVLNTVKKLKKLFDIDVCAGNIATEEGAHALISAGADIVKAGVGPGSICTTRVISGVGVPQLTAVLEAKKACEKYDVSLISDGGIRFSGDISKAIAAGASAVMIGSLFAGTDETPGRNVFVEGRKYKRYRGMGSVGAMEAGSSDRYFQALGQKMVPEGIEGIVPYRGTLSEVVYQLIGGLRSSLGYCGASNIKEFQRKAEFLKVTEASIRESHPHDVKITEEAPNYFLIGNR